MLCIKENQSTNQPTNLVVLSAGWHTSIDSLGRQMNSVQESFNSEFFQGLVFTSRFDFEIFLLLIMIKDI